jgi:hypothetical protein
MSPSISTLKTLFGVSDNCCSFPGCETRMTDPTWPEVMGEVCHIAANSPGGPRYDPTMTDAQRNAYENLILLCPTHHTVIDRLEPDAYTVQELQRMKANAEMRGATRAVHVSDVELERVSAIALARLVAIEVTASSTEALRDEMRQERERHDAEQQRRATDALRERNTANLVLRTERNRQSQFSPWRYWLIVDNQGPHDANDLTVGSDMSSNGKTNMNFPVRVVNPLDLHVGKLLAGRSHRIRLAEPSGVNDTYDIAEASLSWDDGNGPHRSVRRRVQLGWDSGEDLLDVDIDATVPDDSNRPETSVQFASLSRPEQDSFMAMMNGLDVALRVDEIEWFMFGSDPTPGDTVEIRISFKPALNRPDLIVMAPEAALTDL